MGGKYIEEADPGFVEIWPGGFDFEAFVCVRSDISSCTVWDCSNLVLQLPEPRLSLVPNL
jgi:hypothetical protein